MPSRKGYASFLLQNFTNVTATNEALRLLRLAARDNLHGGDLPAFLAEAFRALQRCPVIEAAPSSSSGVAADPSDAAELEVAAEAKEQGVAVAEVTASAFAATTPAEAKSLNAALIS
ncbi:hypothetical protein ON010_g13149 [Phytophthora cinnamomi]|nr:hypothetical protein ON010_g13149 [Phytophthora cinnamomi]